MKIDFQIEEKLPDQEIEVLIQAAAETQTVQQLIWHIENFGTTSLSTVAIKQDDRIVMLRVEDITAFEVFGAELSIVTRADKFQINERLYRFFERIQNQDFVQISKSAVININQLKYLEDSFSGNMTAFLENGLKLNVSRRYLANLTKRLGL